MPTLATSPTFLLPSPWWKPAAWGPAQAWESACLFGGCTTFVLAWALLDAEVHSLWGANHGDGQQQVVADLDSTTSAHSTTMGDLSKHDNIECRILDVGNLGAHVLQEHLCHSKSLFWLCTNLKYAFSCFDKTWTTCQSMKNTMNVRVPAAAALIPPETGASTNWTEEGT